MNRWVRKIDEKLNKIKGKLASFSPEVHEEGASRYTMLLVALFHEGVTFTKARYYELAVECGYTKQGAAGFFAWRKSGGDPPLVVIGDGTHLGLSEWVAPWLREQGEIE